MRRYGVVLLLGALIVAACSRGGGTPRARLIEAWTVPAIKPIGQPVAAGDTMVVYGTVNQDLYLYGVAFADGTIRWRQPASPSVVTAGISLTPRVLDGLVAYLRPDTKANLQVRLVVASPETGGDRLVSEPLLVRSQPTHCSDGKDVCITVLDRDRQSVPRRFSVGAGGLVPDRGSAPVDARFIGDDLLDLGQRQPEILAGFHDGAVRWRSPLTDHFPAGYSTDYGWYLVLYRSAGLHVGSVGHPSVRDDPSTVVTDLSKAQTVAIDAATGASVWRSDGTSFACDGKVSLDQANADDHIEPWPVRCRDKGIARYDRATKALTFEGLDVTVEGFDVPTGRTTWSRPLGSARAFMDEKNNAAAVSDSEVLLQGAAGAVVVDLGTGSTRKPAKGEAFWCATDVFFDYRETRYLPDGGSDRSWRGGKLLDACAADGSPSPVVPALLAKSLGATVGQRTVVATGRGLVAYDRGGR